MTHIMMTYAQISQADIDNNMKEFNSTIDPGLPLAVHPRHQKTREVPGACQGHRVSISKASLVATGMKHALTTGNMTLVWRKWKHRPMADHTWWPNSKARWMAAFAKMHDINHMTMGESTFGPITMEEDTQA